jgi:ribosomal protein L37AE/L43A/DNA-directed RNA polymerase subunit RPC12/RpoP
VSILEKEVWVKLWSKNIPHFEELGYLIPRKRNKSGRLGVPSGTKILVKVDDLIKRSDYPLTKICDDCGKHVLNQPYNAILRCRMTLDGKDRCYDCGRIIAAESKLRNVVNSLEDYAKDNSKEYLIREFSSKNNKKPSEVAYGTAKKFIWNCFTCNGEYEMSAHNRTTSGQNCPHCSGRKVLKEHNDLWTTHPDIAKLLIDKNIGYEISFGSNTSQLLKCENCGHEEFKTISNITKSGYRCSKCSDGISYPEKFMMSLLDQIDETYLAQHRFEWANDKRYDFYIPTLNMIIETHGLQHYVGNEDKSVGWRSLKEEQSNDEYKKKIALKNGIDKYIVVDCRESNMEFIKNSIISSFIDLYDLSKVDWLECHRFTCNSLIKKACDLWNEGVKSTTKIGEILKVSSSTIVSYLKQGVILEWCDYDPVKVMTREVVQLTKEGEFIKEWNSISEAQRTLNIDNIQSACKGITVKIGGFRWAYKDDYEKEDFVVLKHTPKNAKSIIQLTLEGDFIKEWDSTNEMQRELGINNISKVLTGKLNSAGGFAWMYKDEYDKNIGNIEPVKSWSKEIVQLTLDEKVINEFPSLSEASRQTGITRSSLWRACKNKKPKDGFKWIYKDDYYNGDIQD